jgi:hypothetical protein
MGKLLLNLTPREPLTPMNKFPFFDDSIELDVLLVGSLHLAVHDPMSCRLFSEIRIELCRGQLTSVIHIILRTT